jgi:hypothetical protein
MSRTRIAAWRVYIEYALLRANVTTEDLPFMFALRIIINGINPLASEF